MVAILRVVPSNIINAGRGTINTITLAGEKFSNTPLWKRTGGVAVPHFKSAASYWPEPLKFRVFSKDAVGGFAMAALVGAAINRVRA